ncbi:hypothetical protein EMCRGX_G013375 [Ephydatia muelleri]
MNTTALEERTIIIIAASCGGGGLLLVTLSAVVIGCLCYHRKRTTSSTNFSNDGKRISTIAVEESLVFTVSEQKTQVKPTYTETEIATQRRETMLGSRQHPRGDLVLEEKLGDGEYGPVYRAQSYNIPGKKGSRVVTVKMLLEEASEAQRIAFEKDIALLNSFNHVNVMGVLAPSHSPPGGQRLARQSHGAGKVPAKQLLVDMTSPASLLHMADDVCLGMAYLSSQAFVVKDLAARNCIVGADGRVKVADFGVGPSIFPEAYRTLHGRPSPLRWMAAESIESGQYSMASDIWSFGVFIWELFTGGDLPYTEMSDDEVIRYVTKECGKLQMPESCPRDVYTIMLSCWENEAKSRQPFLTLHEHLFELAGEQN